MVIRRTDCPLSLDVQGTAFDVLPETDFLAVAGRNSLTVVRIGTSPHSSPSSLVQLRHNRNLVRLLKFNPLGTGRFATVSGPFVDVYTLGQGSTVRRLASLQAQSRKVADFCWCPFDDQLMMSCAEGDSVSFWDLRSDLCRPSAQLGLLFGAGQAKFAPHLNNLVLSATGSDLRLWDLRHTSQPIVQFKGHQSRVLCLDWHPHHQEPNTFFTSANDGALKLWSFGEQRSEPIVFNVAPISAWRLVFSQEGQELAALSLSPTHSVALFFHYGLENIRQLKGVEKGDILMDAAWHKSTSALKSTTKFLYTLSKKRRLCRHAIAYELSNEIRDEMSTPIMQSAVDEERDRLIAAAASAVAERTEIHAPNIFEERSRKETELPSPTHLFPRHSVGSGQSLGKVPPPGTANLKSLIGSLKAEGGKLIGTTDGGHKTPQSPIYSDWHRWIKAPNVIGGDLLTELEALRKHSTDGLYTTEVNFQRAAIAFSYMHQNRFRKICWEMRFHREFIENGLVFVEIIQNDSPLTPEKASLFLTLLQQECDEQLRVPSTQTVLCRVFHQLPKLIDLMKLFPLPIDVPSTADLTLSKASSKSGSANEDSEFVVANQQQQSSATTVELSIPAKKQSLVSSVAGPALFPVTFAPSPFDHHVPAPRNCGARFNASGYLVTFGKTKNAAAPTAMAKLLNQQQNKPKQQLQKTDNGAKNGRQNARKISAVTPKMNTSIGTDESAKKMGLYPRSLAEYCVLVNSPHAFPTATLFRQCSSMAASTSAIPFTQNFQCSPPVRCLSPLRPASPWARPVDAGDRSADAEQAQETEDSSGRVGAREPNSLSPPSLMRQQNALLAGTIGRIMGSSPNSSISLTAINPRTFSLHFHHQQQQQQSPAFQAMMRQRVTTLGECAMTSANPHPPPIHHQMSAMTELSAAKSLVGWPMAVMPEQQGFTSTVFVYDTVSLLPISQELARSYKLLGSSPLAICRHNREQAAKKGRRDLLTVWQLLEQCVRNCDAMAKKSGECLVSGNPTKHSTDFFSRAFGLRPKFAANALISSAKRSDAPWAIHPFGRSLINRILGHYVSRNDLQTAAVITCVLDGLNSDGRKVEKERRTSDKKGSAAFTRKMERQKHFGEVPKKTPDALPTAGPTKETQMEQVEGLFFAMDQADTSSSGKVPPAPPVPPLLPSQQLQMPPSRKTSAAQGGVGTTLASVMPSLSFVGGPWSRQSSESNAVSTVFASPLYSARTMSEALHTSATSERLSPGPDAVTPYQRSATMEAATGSSTNIANSTELANGRKADEEKENEENELLLDPSLSPRLEQLRRRYADILYRWRMYRKCAEVLKYCSRRDGDDASVGTFNAICWCTCCGQQQLASPKCTKCHRIPIYCAICEQPCKGIVTTCSMCSHGGHFAHLTAWFTTQSLCPLGCGCECRF